MQSLPGTDGVDDPFDEDTIAPTPLHQALRWLREAISRQQSHADIVEPAAMSLATATPEGDPTARIVFMRHLDDGGPSFVTNKASGKVRDITANPRVCATVTWLPLFRAIQFHGVAVALERELLQTFWDQRPRGSQVTMAASHMSQPVAQRAELQRMFDDEALRHPDGEAFPMPDDFVGYRIACRRVEFLNGRENRLHDRLVFTSDGTLGLGAPGWHLHRVMP